MRTLFNCTLYHAQYTQINADTKITAIKECIKSQYLNHIAINLYQLDISNSAFNSAVISPKSRFLRSLIASSHFSISCLLY